MPGMQSQTLEGSKRRFLRQRESYYLIPSDGPLIEKWAVSRWAGVSEMLETAFTMALASIGDFTFEKSVLADEGSDNDDDPTRPSLFIFGRATTSGRVGVGRLARWVELELDGETIPSDELGRVTVLLVVSGRDALGVGHSNSENTGGAGVSILREGVAFREWDFASELFLPFLVTAFQVESKTSSISGEETGVDAVSLPVLTGRITLDLLACATFCLGGDVAPTLGDGFAFSALGDFSVSTPFVTSGVTFSAVFSF